MQIFSLLSSKIEQVYCNPLAKFFTCYNSRINPLLPYLHGTSICVRTSHHSHTPICYTSYLHHITPDTLLNTSIYTPIYALTLNFKYTGSFQHGAICFGRIWADGVSTHLQNVRRQRFGGSASIDQRTVCGAAVGFAQLHREEGQYI